MSDEVAQPADHHHHEEIEKIETISSTTTPWGVRLAFGIVGLVLLVGSFVAWEFRAALPASITDSLPWIIAVAVLLGVGAIMESITTEIWITVIVGLFLAFIAFVVVGRVSVYPQGSTIYVVDRFTGDAQLCSSDGCKLLPRDSGFAKAPEMKVPAVPAMATPVAAPAAEPVKTATEPMKAAPATTANH